MICLNTACARGINYGILLNTILSHSHQMQFLMKHWATVLNSGLLGLQKGQLLYHNVTWQTEKVIFLLVRLCPCDIQMKFIFITCSLPIQRKMQKEKISHLSGHNDKENEDQ